MRALLAIATLALASCAVGASETCATDADCDKGLVCIETTSPPTAAEADNKVAGAPVHYCVKPCTKDADCADVSNTAKCAANVGGKIFCAEPVQ
jgi:hypothetical protein